jgi:ABC-type lipoprotein release transport system permease subunit
MWRALSVGWFLALRQVVRGNPWTTILIVLIMTLTFLNLVVVSGVLIGLPVGAALSYNQQYSGDVFIRAFPNKAYIERTSEILAALKSFPEVKAVSPRYIQGARIESNYRTRIGPKQEPDAVAAPVTGIDPTRENLVTSLGERMLEGEMLHEGEEGYILLGKNLVDTYTLGARVISATTLTNVPVGAKVRVIIGESTQEMIVKGVLGSKAGEVSTRAFILDSEMRRLTHRNDQNADEIAIRLHDPSRATAVRDALRAMGFDKVARVETSRESQGTFLDDIERTFTILSGFVGVIGLLVASITVFIVIFINAVTRRKYIGILKGIGISGTAIELSYVIQSVFYAGVGSLIGVALVYGVLEPYFLKHPINFPFSDGVLLVPWDGTLARVGILMLVTVLAGYAPARMIVRRNTLDAILGR